MNFFDKVIAFIKKHHVYILTFIYACVTLVFITRHEMFQDEIDVWAALTNVPLAELPKHVTLAGHPVIYFFLLYPFAKLGFHIEFLHFISWSASAAAVFLLLRYSPFSFPTKLIITFSAPFLYWFPVIARSYSVIPLIIFTLSILYHKLSNYALRDKKYGFMIISLCALSGLTANIHFIFDMLGGIIFIFYVCDQFIVKKEFNKYNIAGAILFAILLLIPAIQTFFASTVSFRYDGKGSLPLLFSGIFTTGANFINNRVLFDIFTNLHALIFFITFILLFVCDKKVFTIVFAANFFHCLIYVLKYSIFLANRTYCLHLVMLAGVWLAFNKQSFIADKDHILKKRISEIFLALLLLLSIPDGIASIVNDWKYPYSTAKIMAEYINENIPNNENVRIYVTNPNIYCGVDYFLKDRHLYTESNEPLRYMQAYKDRFMDKLPIPKKHETFYVIAMKSNHNKHVEQIYCPPQNLTDFRECLYKIKNDH